MINEDPRSGGEQTDIRNLLDIDDLLEEGDDSPLVLTQDTVREKLVATSSILKPAPKRDFVESVAVQLERELITGETLEITLNSSWQENDSPVKGVARAYNEGGYLLYCQYGTDEFKLLPLDAVLKYNVLSSEDKINWNKKFADSGHCPDLEE